jgi:hypothetical protein
LARRPCWPGLCRHSDGLFGADANTRSGADHSVVHVGDSAVADTRLYTSPVKISDCQRMNANEAAQAAPAVCPFPHTAGTPAQTLDAPSTRSESMRHPPGRCRYGARGTRLLPPHGVGPADRTTPKVGGGRGRVRRPALDSQLRSHDLAPRAGDASLLTGMYPTGAGYRSWVGCCSRGTGSAVSATTMTAAPAHHLADHESGR